MARLAHTTYLQPQAADQGDLICEGEEVQDRWAKIRLTVTTVTLNPFSITLSDGSMHRGCDLWKLDFVSRPWVEVTVADGMGYPA